MSRRRVFPRSFTRSQQVSKLAQHIRALSDDQLVEIAGAAFVAKIGGGPYPEAQPKRWPIGWEQRELSHWGIGPRAKGELHEDGCFCYGCNRAARAT